MTARRQVQTPGAKAAPEETKTTAEKADEALAEIGADADQHSGAKAAEPTNEELQRQLAEMQAQMDELKKSTQIEQRVSSGSIDAVKPKKRIPFLTEKGWTTKEAD
ncbi:hypothetical protein MMO38_06640 [Acinetobacter sp. NIPH 1852]|uniref:hypothetical protein n=1 Tax=Acinetobacter sp. NIPH 1852 TaxID=2923428 RepID=UPI001F4A592C|nr:hypothetical protein [Acinetobacter sp. NIPH 1852]MCH7307817.1 hypothetical protein [Acinetobacter sp. NIPH 1852]